MKNFIMIEKELISMGLKGNCLNLFLMMLDRHSLSEKNGWKDDKGRTYIIMKVSEIEERLSVCKRTASSLLGQLEDALLITRKKQGFGKPSLIFITYQNACYGTNITQSEADVNGFSDKNNKSYKKFEDYSEAYGLYQSWWDKFIQDELKDNPQDTEVICAEEYLSDAEECLMQDEEGINEETEYVADGEASPADAIWCEDRHEEFGHQENKCMNYPECHVPNTRCKKLHLQKCKKLHLQKCKKLHLNNNTNYNNINNECNIYNNHNHHDEDSMTLLFEAFKENIEYNYLRQSCSTEVLNLITDTVRNVFCTGQRQFNISGRRVGRQELTEKLMKLDSGHIEYVTECINGITSSIRNPRAYMLACLYNASDTIDEYYMLQVKADMNKWT